MLIQKKSGQKTGKSHLTLQCDKSMTSLLNSPVIHCLEKVKCLFQREQFKKNYDVSVHEKDNLFQCEYCKQEFHTEK